jgi:hypothetical protein
MKSKNDKKQTTFEKDYHEIMKGLQNQNTPFIQTPQWTNPNDFIVKFSLYQETPNSITSTDTLVNLGL